jgi:hypothetical protein
LEVLIALTASLLLMLGLTRAYKLLGDRITERQSQLELSSKLRDTAIRLRDELRRTTCNMAPPANESEDEGYLVYHEGPFTAATTTLGSAQNPAPLDTSYFRDSRYGDIDDYLAFTSRSDVDSPFVGFIPRGVLMAHQFANNQMTSIGAYTHRDATELVPFYSKVAEIAYWISPRYERESADGTLVYNGATPSTTQPVMIDRNEDLLPDRLDLHRRVLLVRPDLNMTPAEMFLANASYGASNFTVPALTADVPTVPFLTVDSNGDLILMPLSFLSGPYGNQSFYPSQSNVAPAPAIDRVVAPGVWWNVNDPNNPDYPSPSWLTGVARVQQFMDLSISRVTDTWTAQPAGRGVAMTGANHYGMPTAILRANSLGDLSRPENRFGFVRIPEPIISGQQGSSMPQLALCPPHQYLHSRFTSAPLPPTGVPLSDHVLGPPWPSTFPAQADDGRLMLPVNDVNFLNPFGRFTMTTFLRPEFALADRVTDRGAVDRGANPSPVAIANRGGSDIIATDVLGFDVQIYDPAAPKFIWEGPDRVPGTSSAVVPPSTVAGDDDGDGFSPTDPNEDLDEMGAPGSDDEAVAVSGLRIDEVLVDNGTRLANGGYDFNTGAISRFGLVDRGDFVDLNYARLAGGPMRGLYQTDIATGNLLTSIYLSAFESPYSGVQLPTQIFGGQTYVPYPDSWVNSGRFVLRQAGGSPIISSFYQPVYDTWTNGYSNDAFDQEGLVSLGSYTQEPLDASGNNIIGSYTERRVPQSNAATAPGTANMLLRPVLQLSARRWTSLGNSIARTGGFAGESSGINQRDPTGPDPFETEPPIRERLKALKISIRVDDFGSETIRQQTVIQEF